MNERKHERTNARKKQTGRRTERKRGSNIECHILSINIKVLVAESNQQLRHAWSTLELKRQKLLRLAEVLQI